MCLDFFERRNYGTFRSQKSSLLTDSLEAVWIRNLENLGITTAQMNVLCYMEHHTGRNVTQKQLSEAFNVKHSTMAGILQRMVEKGLLEIRPNPDNKKFKNIFLTEKAKSLQDKASAYREYTESVVIKDFTPDEKEYFEKTLFKVFHNLLNDSSLSQEEKDLIERRFRKMIKTLLGQVKEFKLVSLLTPLGMLAEVIVENFIPLQMAVIIDSIGKNDLSTIYKTSFIMLLLALSGLLPDIWAVYGELRLLQVLQET